MPERKRSRTRSVIRRTREREPEREIPSKRDETFDDYSLQELKKALEHEENYSEEELARGVVRAILTESLALFLSPGYSNVRSMETLSRIVNSWEKRRENREKRIKLLKRKIRELT